MTQGDREAGGTDRTVTVTQHKQLESCETTCSGSSQGSPGTLLCTHATSALCCLPGTPRSFGKPRLLVFLLLCSQRFFPPRLAMGLA